MTIRGLRVLAWLGILIAATAPAWAGPPETPLLLLTQAAADDKDETAAPPAADKPAPVAEDKETFSQDEVLKAASDFFGGVAAGLADVIEKVFKEQGRPNGYITGEEASAAITVGLRYGKGRIRLKNGGTRMVYWQGPSIGFDLGANASKVFTLVYGMNRTTQLFQRFPGVDGSLYVVAGFSLNYQRSGRITLAPIRAGVGLRAGINVGYLHYSRESSWIPF